MLLALRSLYEPGQVPICTPRGSGGMSTRSTGTTDRPALILAYRPDEDTDRPETGDTDRGDFCGMW